MTQHRFDKIARNLTAPLWQCVRDAIANIQDWLRESDESLSRIRRALADAEDLARDALMQMASKLFVFAGKPRARREDSAEATPPPPREKHAPTFRLCLAPEPIEHEIIATGESNSDAAPANYSPTEILERRMAALEDVLTAPGRHAARMKRALHRREDSEAGHLTLKSEDDIFLDHAERLVDDPSYFGTQECTRTHAMFFDTS